MKKPIRWIHISDLHIGSRGHEIWQQIQDDFKRNIKEWVPILGIPDIVLITGDLTNSAKREEFSKLDDFIQTLINLFRSLTSPNALDPLIIPVPGNHDLIRPTESELYQYRLFDNYCSGASDIDVMVLQRELWEKKNPGRLVPLFNSYNNWFKDKIESQFKCRSDVSYHISHFFGDLSIKFSPQGHPSLVIVGLNTAWLQYCAGNFEGKLAIPVSQFQSALLSSNTNGNGLEIFDHSEYALLLMHHPVNWLHPIFQNDFFQSIYRPNRFTLCLHGHLHEARASGYTINAGEPRYFFQAPSLFGLDNYGEGYNERRQMGYVWGSLSSEGEVRVWPLEWREGHFVFDSRFLSSPTMNYLDGIVIRPGKSAPAIIPSVQRLNRPIGINRLPPPSSGRVFGRHDDIIKLNMLLDDSHVSLVGIQAQAGVGKSTLIREWLNQLVKNSNAFSRCYIWSFSDQDSTTQPSSSNLFFEGALRYFGYHGDLPRYDEDKGDVIAKLLRRERAILILDGIESLQEPGFPLGGGILGMLKDTAIKRLLVNVARDGLEPFGGLVLISTRAILPDLDYYNIDAGFGYLSMPLNNLSRSDGAALLRYLGVKGDEFELQETSHEYGGNALALVLLGKLLAKNRNGDVKFRYALPSLLDVQHFGDQTRRIMQYYDDFWYEDSPERVLLYMISMVHRPMVLDEFQVLLDHSKLASRLKQEDLDAVYKHLEDAGLLIKDPETISRIKWDTHALVREFFRELLRERRPDEWCQAEQVLFQYFVQAQKKEQPDYLWELEPLYRAIHHGCLGGLYKDALAIYRNRIIRDDWVAYSTNTLGAASQDLAALNRFFIAEGPKPTDLSNTDWAWLYGRSAFCLMQLGELAKSKNHRESEMKYYESNEDWMNAARCAGELVNLFILMGALGAAENMALRAVNLADSPAGHNAWIQWGQRKQTRAILGTVYFYQGDFKNSLQNFMIAEQMQCDGEKTKYLLYGAEGWPYCKLLIEQAQKEVDYDSLLLRLENILDWDQAAQPEWMLPVAFDRLAKGLVLMYKCNYEGASYELNQAVELIRKTASIVYLPEALLARAAFRRKRNLLDAAREDINEALDITRTYSMPLYQAEAWLLSSHLWLDLFKQQNKSVIESLTRACEAYNEAKTIVHISNYALRMVELDLLAARLAYYKGFGHDAYQKLINAKHIINSTQHWSLLRVCEIIRIETNID